MTDNSKTITLELTVDDANNVLAALNALNVERRRRGMTHVADSLRETYGRVYEQAKEQAPDRV